MEYWILGPLEVRSGDTPIGIRSIRQRKLLALLILNANRSVSVSRFVEELWEVPPRSSRQQIHNTVGGLRQVLGADPATSPIRTTETGYQLDAGDGAVDVDRFRGAVQDAARAAESGDESAAVTLLETALEVWRGPALCGLDGPAITGAAARLEEQRLAAIDSYYTLRLRQGTSEVLLADLWELVGSHPTRESLRESLMLALYRSGRRADALEVYDQGRRRLADELGIDPGPRIRALHEDILRGSLQQAPARWGRPGNPAAGASGAAGPEPAAEGRGPVRHGWGSLPPDVADFAGRTAEIDQLLGESGRLAPSTLVISAVDGMGGVGKTALAIHLAHRVAADFPDGQYFVDLNGFAMGADPMSPAQALDLLLRNSGVPAELVPPSLPERTALWRSGMAGKRAVLVLDNATGVDQIRPLLPNAGGVLVVVTSRRRLTALEGATPLSLDILPPHDAAELFTRIAGADRVVGAADQVTAVVELCGRLPLAIRVAAARLRHRPAWTVSDLADRLASHRRRTRFLEVRDVNVMKVLELSYRHLGPDQQRLFRLLGLHPAPDFEAGSVAALADLPPDEAEALLDCLYEDNLLLQRTAGRFQFHDLVRDCAVSLAFQHDEEKTRDEAVSRLLDHYLWAVYVWCGRLGAPHRSAPTIERVPEGLTADPDREATLLRLGTEYGNLLTVARYAATHGWHQHAWQLPYFLQPYLQTLYYGGRTYELFTDALGAARASGDVRGQSASLQGLSTVNAVRGRHDEARRQLKEAVALSHEVGDEMAELVQRIGLGNIEANRDRLMPARDEYQAALVLAEAVGDRAMQSAVVNNLGVVHRNLGSFDQALECFHRALRLEPGPHSPNLPMFLWNIGSVLHLRGDLREALARFTEVLELSRAASSRYGEALGLVGLCTVGRALGRPTAAEDGRAALVIAREMGLHKLECDTLSALGDTFVSQGDLERAEHVFGQAEQLASGYRLPRCRARAFDGLAHAARARAETGRAARRWRRALELYAADMVDAGFATRHLAAPGDPAITCPWCQAWAD